MHGHLMFLSQCLREMPASSHPPVDMADQPSDGPAMPAALYTMVSIPEAQLTVLKEVSPLQAVTVPLQEAVGLVLAGDVIAPEPLPPFPASIKVIVQHLRFCCTHCGLGGLGHPLYDRKVP